MKNLLERLKPEIKDNLLKDKEVYPSLVGGLFKTLENNVAITQLTLEDVNNLSSFSPTSINKILEVYEMFEES